MLVCSAEGVCPLSGGSLTGLVHHTPGALSFAWGTASRTDWGTFQMIRMAAVPLGSSAVVTPKKGSSQKP